MTLEDDLVTAARQQAGERGFSAYLNDALRRQLQRDRLVDLLDESERANGPVDPRELDRVRSEWPEQPAARRRRSA